MPTSACSRRSGSGENANLLSEVAIGEPNQPASIKPALTKLFSSEANWLNGTACHLAYRLSALRGRLNDRGFMIRLFRDSFGGPEVSVFVPVYNEAGNLTELDRQVMAALESLGRVSRSSMWMTGAVTQVSRCSPPLPREIHAYEYWPPAQPTVRPPPWLQASMPRVATCSFRWTPIFRTIPGHRSSFDQT